MNVHRVFFPTPAEWPSTQHGGDVGRSCEHDRLSPVGKIGDDRKGERGAGRGRSRSPGKRQKNREDKQWEGRIIKRYFTCKAHIFLRLFDPGTATAVSGPGTGRGICEPRRRGQYDLFTK